MDVAKQLTFTGQVLSSKEAQELGLVTQVASYTQAMNMARKLPVSHLTRFARQKIVRNRLHADAKTGLELEAELQAGLIGSANQREAIARTLPSVHRNLTTPSNAMSWEQEVKEIERRTIWRSSRG